MRLPIILFFFITNIFSQSLDPPYISSYKNYPLNKEVKIFFDEQWRPITEIDSASYYRLVTFSEPNIPKIKNIKDYYINGDIRSNFYADYIGVNSKGIDSIVSATGMSSYYFKGGSKESEYFIYNSKKVGLNIEYFKSGAIKYKQNYIDDQRQGEAIGYHESGAIQYTRNYIDDKLDGDSIFYYESGEISSTSLSKNLLQPNIPIEQVFKNVYTEVWTESKNQQSPVYESKLSGEEFILNPE